MDGQDDHVHLLVNDPPKIPLTKLVKSLSRIDPPSPNAPGLAAEILERRSVVARAYFAATCDGASVNIIRQYIERQRTPD